MELNDAGPAVLVGRISDRELWALAVDGDREAFGRIFDRHARTVYDLLLRRTADRAEAEDLTSAVFVHAWRRRSQPVLDRDSVLPRLLRTADRLVPSTWRRLRATLSPLQLVWQDEPVGGHADRVAGGVDDGCRMSQVHRAQARFPRQGRGATGLCVWSGLDRQAAVTALGVTAGAVESRPHRAGRGPRAGFKGRARGCGVVQFRDFRPSGGGSAMNDVHGIPAAPPDRGLPNHRRIREELIMKINSKSKSGSSRRSWGLPLGVAAAAAAVGVASVSAFGAHAAVRPALTNTALDAGIASSSGPASPSASATPTHSTTPVANATPGAGSGTGGSVSSGPVTPAPVSWTFVSGKTTPIAAGAVAKILASCLGSDASQYHAVIAQRTPVATQDTDGVVVAVNSAGQYVQCETKGDKGTSPDSPPTFINNRLWNAGHTIEFFDSTGEPAAHGQYLSLGAGHYTSDVARITISYGSDSKEYPAIMAGGAFFYASDMTSGSTASGPGTFVMGPNPYIHAYNAAGQEIYNQVKDA